MRCGGWPRQRCDPNLQRKPKNDLLYCFAMSPSYVKHRFVFAEVSVGSQNRVTFEGSRAVGYNIRIARVLDCEKRKGAKNCFNIQDSTRIFLPWNMMSFCLQRSRISFSHPVFAKQRFWTYSGLILAPSIRLLSWPTLQFEIPILKILPLSTIFSMAFQDSQSPAGSSGILLSSGLIRKHMTSSNWSTQSSGKKSRKWP